MCIVLNVNSCVPRLGNIPGNAICLGSNAPSHTPEKGAEPYSGHHLCVASFFLEPMKPIHYFRSFIINLNHLRLLVFHRHHSLISRTE